MKVSVKNFLSLFLGGVFVLSCVMVGYQYWQHETGTADYAEAEAVAGLTEDVEAGEIAEEPVPLAELPEEAEILYPDILRDIDLDALRAVNDEVIGWIMIPDTVVTYPLLRSEDNEKYLERTWQGKYSSIGSIFMECQNSADFSDFHTVVYGHNTIHGSMFGSLKHYAEQDYFAEHPYIFIATPEGIKTYAVFSAYEAGVKEQTYRIGGWDEESREDFLDFCVERSVIETGVSPDDDDPVLTLSTCTGRGYRTRWVVQAVLV